MQAFPCGLKLKCWRTSTPSPPGCPAPSSRFQPRMKSSSESGCVLSLETAECPEPLCPWRALPAHGATSRVASEDITPPSSLIRAHASDQVPPGASVVPRTPGPCRLSPVPAGGWPFPTLSLQSLRRRLDPYPAASLECTCPFLPREHRPHATEDAFGTRNCPCNATSTGSRISGSIRVSQRYFGAFRGFFVNDLMGKALWSSWKTRSVFQGAVGAFCASTAPSASTGPICMRQDRRVLGLQSTRE